jgi:hypothetical protein
MSLASLRRAVSVRRAPHLPILGLGAAKAHAGRGQSPEHRVRFAALQESGYGPERRNAAAASMSAIIGVAPVGLNFRVWPLPDLAAT